MWLSVGPTSWASFPCVVGQRCAVPQPASGSQSLGCFEQEWGGGSVVIDVLNHLLHLRRRRREDPSVPSVCLVHLKRMETVGEPRRTLDRSPTHLLLA